MKIALLTEKYTPDIGGLAISSERFVRLLSSAGHQVRVFAPTLSLPPSEKHSLSSNGVSVTRFGAHKRVDDTLVDWFELIVEAHKQDPFDVLHAYFITQAGYVAAYTGRFLGTPSVVSIRGNDIERAPFDPSKFSHVMFTLQNADAITANASELVKKAKAFVDREVYLIPNGVDTDHFKPNEKLDKLIQTFRLTTYGASGSTPDFGQGQASLINNRVIGFVGELRKKKGLSTLLAAYAKANKVKPITLFIVGTIRQGDDRKIFEEFMTLNPNSQIIITGYISPKDLPAYYSRIDIFVHPSLRDGMPNAVLEAMACGKPVIATQVGGIKDFLEDGKNGILVKVNDENMLAEKILELLDNTKRRAELGKNARELIINRFTLEKELKANLDIYRKLGLNP